MVISAQTKDNLDVHTSAIKDGGYTVIPSVLNSAELSRAKSILLDIFAREKRTGSRENWADPAYQISLCLPVKHQLFRDLCAIPQALELARHLLGDDCVVGSMNGFTTKPHGQIQPMHLDFPGARSLMTSLLFIICLDDFTVENGCTRVVPRSQRKFGTLNNFDHLEGETLSIEASAGSLIVCDGDIVHGAGANQTSDLRLALHLVYSLSWVKPQWDIALSMRQGVRDRLTDSERKLFGLDGHSYVLDGYTGRPIEYSRRGRLKYYLRRLRSKMRTGL